MPSTTTYSSVNDSSTTKLMQDTAISGLTSTNKWITGGTIGSKNAVLVFKTSALVRYGNEDEHGNTSQKSSSSPMVDSEKSRFPPICVAKTANRSEMIIKPLTIRKNFLAKDFDLDGNRSTKPTSGSLSSSENSISSACDDPTDLEAAIVKAEKSSLNDERAIGTVTTSEMKTTCDSIGDSNGDTDEPASINEANVLAEHHDGTSDETGTAAINDMPASILKITYKFMNTETKLLKRILFSHGLTEADKNQNFNLMWTGLHMKPDVLRSLLPYQRVNHFPRSYELTRKDRLYKNIEKMQHLRGMRHFDIVPLSFMLPLEYRNLVHAHRSGHKGPWIVKPAASSRGRGIYLVNTPEQIPLDDQVIVSKYIADPLCIDGHKCDVRLYVVVTSFDPLLIYLYEEGLVRLATVKYDKTAENLWNPCMHLCNYSINKYHSDYIKATETDEDVGHKWTFSALLRHLKNQGSDITALMLNIEDVIIKSIFACSQSIVSACRMFVPNGNNCFELYGFDILIDNTLKPWLLEVNLSPSLGIDTPLDARVKSALLTDLLTLTGIPAISPLSRAATDNQGARSKVALSDRRSCNEMSSSSSKGCSTNKRISIGLSTEEYRILKSVRAQNARKGGFVRIYPTEDSMQRYGMFLDSTTGIPMSIVNSTSIAPGFLAHNFNQMLHLHLFGCVSKSSKDGCSIDERMAQYGRTLNNLKIDTIFKTTPPKCLDEARRLRKQMRKSMESGNELTLLQARKIFATFLECILRRLSHEPKNQHEKFVLKFITRSDLSIKPPDFMRNPYSTKIHGKDRSAVVAKLLGDYLETFNRDTDSCVDNYDYYGLIPSQLFDDFLTQAQESDLESILALHVNLTQNLSFLYNRCTTQMNVPAAPPIPTGANGFLKALPSMAPSVTTRDLARIDSYYKSLCSAAAGLDKEKNDSTDELDKTATNRISNVPLCAIKKRSNVVNNIN